MSKSKERLKAQKRANKERLARAFNTHISPLLAPIGNKETLSEYQMRLTLGVALYNYHLFAIGKNKELDIHASRVFTQFNLFDLDE